MFHRKHLYHYKYFSKAESKKCYIALSILHARSAVNNHLFILFILESISSVWQYGSTIEHKNDMKTETKSKKSAIKEARNMQRELLDNAHDIGNVLTTASNVSPVFMPHVFNMHTGKHGIKNLIAEILTERGAVFPKGIELTEFRKVATAASMFASEIIDEVQARFTAGTTRYPYETIHLYLSVFMFRSGMIGKIKLTNAEDKPRSCFKPRIKWYLIQQ